MGVGDGGQAILADEKRRAAHISPEEDKYMIGKTGSIRACCLVVAALLAMAVSAFPSWGSEIPVTLTDQNSTVQVYSQTDAGLGSWTVNGVSII